MDAGPLTSGDLNGPETPSEAVMPPMNETDGYGTARAPLGGSGGLVKGE